MTQPPNGAVPVPDAAIMKRLGFARLLYEQAVAQSFAPAPLKVSSLLAFHDVMEFLFLVAVAHVGAAQGIDPKKPFSENVKKLLAADGAGVSSIDALTRVAYDRNGFKHNGSIPGPEQIESARRDATVFLEGNCLRFFGIAFAEVSMLHLVHQAPVRAHLQAGRSAADAGDLATAMSELALAFDQLISDWGENKRLPGAAMRRAPFELNAGGPTPKQRIAPLSSPADATTRRALGEMSTALRREFDAVAQELAALHELMRVQISGVDMQRYLRFAMIAPTVSTAFGGSRSTSPNAGQFHYTSENYTFCEMFVIDSALRLGEGDFDMWLPRTYGDWDRAQAAMDSNGGWLPPDMA